VIKNLLSFTLYIRGHKPAVFRARTNNGRSVFRSRKPWALAVGASFLLMLPLPIWAQEQAAQSQSDVKQGSQLAQEGKEALSKETKEATYSIGETDELNYTLGTNDVIEIIVQNHPELSGRFPVNSEGKIQYEFAGDVALGGMIKKAAEDKIREVISRYVIDPKLILKIVEYHSKAVYVIGQVTRPGKYYMRSEGIPVREAIVEAGMPIPGSAMHRARLITPSKNSEAVIRIVDLNALLYKGDLQYNFEMYSGDQLYVPTTQEEMDYIQVKSENSPVLSEADATKPTSEEVRYTLGPEDVIKITVQNHPEVSGTYSVNLEGKIQMDMVGDVDVTGLTKKELEEKIGKLISGYVDKPDISVTILEYRSKVYYVIGEVGHPGKFFMRSESIPVREAVVEAGLPTLAAAMRKCRLITPGKNGKVITKDVDLYTVLYAGNLDKNLEMHPGDFLYVPSTVMAKILRVIAPVAEPVSSAASAQTGVGALGNNPIPKRSE
jgi:polysaccharide export outer membrane protein